MSIYKRKNSDVWWADIQLPGIPRLRQSTGETDQKQAQRVHDELKAQLWSARPKLKGRTWGGAVIAWASVEGRGEPDILSMQKFAKVYKDREITEVTRESVVEALAFCRSPATFNRYIARISAILNLSKDNGWLDVVPKLPRKKVTTQPRKWITHEQWDALLQELPAHMKPMASFAIQTGLRQANVLGLTWDRVDLDRKLVWVEGIDTKANKPIAVPLSQEAVATLRSVAGQHKTAVFTFRGKPIKEVKTAWQAACIRAGLGHTDEDGKYVGFTWHGMRHTWATWHIQNGTPLDVLKSLGGWSDLRMVLNYAHHSAGHLASFADNTRKKT